MEKYKTTGKITKSVITEMLDLKEKNKLIAEEVVNQARNSNSCLNGLFEWNDGVAGEKYRLQQARVLINEVKIIVDSKEYYAFENVKVQVSEDAQTGSPVFERQYFTRKEIIEDKSLREQVLERALKNLLYWKHQYEGYVEFKPIIEAIKCVDEIVLKEKAKKDNLIKSSDLNKALAD